MIEDLVVLRAVEESELNFIYHSWLRSLRSGNQFYKNIPGAEYFDNHRKRLYRLLDRSSCIIATPRDHPDIIVAYIVWESPEGDDTIIHYIYVKSDYRKMGLGGLLVEVASGGKNIIATHTTGSVKDKKFTFNPYLMEHQDD